MNLKNLFRVSGLLLMISGIMWMVSPASAPSSLGMEIDATGAYYIQQLGATTVGIALLMLLVSGMAPTPARQAVATAVVVFQASSAILNLLAVLGGTIPTGSGWFGVILNLVFALAFAYFRFIRPETA